MPEEMEQLLSEAEQTLYFVTSAIQLSVKADYDSLCMEITNVLETSAEMAEKTREKITNALLQLLVARNKMTGD